MFKVTQVGSWPRSEGGATRPVRARVEHVGALTDLQKAYNMRRLVQLERRHGANVIRQGTEFDRIADGEVRRAVELQLEAGVDIVVDGEQRRDNFVSFVTEKLDGARLMSLTDTADDKDSFSEELAAADVPPDSIMNAVCVGKLKRRDPLAVDEYKFVRNLTDRPIKVPLPGPYISLVNSLHVVAPNSRASITRSRPTWPTISSAS